MFLSVSKSSALASFFDNTHIASRRYSVSDPTGQEFKKCSTHNRFHYMDFRLFLCLVSSTFCDKLLVSDYHNQAIRHAVFERNGFRLSQKTLLVVQNIFGC